MAQTNGATMDASAPAIEIRVGGAVVFSTRAPEVPYGAGEPVNTAAGAVLHFATIREQPMEVFAVMALDGANREIAVRWVSVGLLDQCQVHPREVFADAIKDRAASIILAHNHPSGQLQASPEDGALTSRLVKAGELLGIRVLDHLILTRDGYVSMKSSGLM